MTNPDEVWDDGLQPERTGLAWQRAALAFLGLGLALPKLAWPAFGPMSILPSVVVTAGASALFVASHQRYRLTHYALTSHNALLHGGVLVALATLLTLVLALVAVTLVAIAALT